MNEDEVQNSFWSISANSVLQRLESKISGLPEEEAKKRLKKYGPNTFKKEKHNSQVTIFLNQFKSPIIVILLFAASLSFGLHDKTDGAIILLIVFISGMLGFWHERGAANALRGLLSLVQVKVNVQRDTDVLIPLEDVVPGDIVQLRAGDIIPGDCRIIESNDLFVDEATLTGETFPSEKEVDTLPVDTPLAARKCALWMGTHVVSGSAKVVVVSTGGNTEFGKIAKHLSLKPVQTEFEHGIQTFGYFLMEVTFVLVFAIFAINVTLKLPVLEAFLFSLALAVGLTPQLLPAIISINLAHGAKKMAQNKVIVKKLSSIENFGSMSVLCSDKTGTITEGKIVLVETLGVDGISNEILGKYAYYNASLESGFINPIDEAIRKRTEYSLEKVAKLDEIPYDFSRKRLSIAFREDDLNIMVTKGALQNILDICTLVELSSGKQESISKFTAQITDLFTKYSAEGFRVLGLGYKNLGTTTKIEKAQEKDLIFLGFLVLSDPIKKDIKLTIQNLKKVGVDFKVITGDNQLVATSVARSLGIDHPKIMTGAQLKHIGSRALIHLAKSVDVFAEVEPNQKESIVIALRKGGLVVGYMGDGINDVSALHAADVGISVNSAVDIAKESADIVLLENDLQILLQGIQLGRETFANTLKYVFMATSANFGNMFSMAGASLFLPFLPLLPKQVLLTNLLTDFPEMTIASDAVDLEMVEKPRRWDIKFIRKFMFTFGLVSSIFDFTTFGVLLFLLHASPGQFRTGWFMESVISASLIVLVIRTRKPFYKSLPGKYLLFTTLLIVGVTLILPWTVFAQLFGFEAIPLNFYFILTGIIVSYIFVAEVAKHVFYKYN